ncbi:MAG: hypothetical protein FIA89_02265 [Geobacter sp.]|nr:hypothetical protein [Geobacter sp.]
MSPLFSVDFNKGTARIPMIHMLFIVGVLIMFPVTSSYAFPAKQMTARDCKNCHVLTRQEATHLLRGLNVTAKEVKFAPVKGLFEVLAERDGKEGVVFIDFGKQFIMQGVFARVPALVPKASEEQQHVGD